MFSTCLFCNVPLGSNEMFECFPVGRRIAYDESTGRLWVVCRGCKRWNLSPQESRWETIEAAERAFRATKMRVSTDNIGMAQLRDGTELVRIGKPPALEFAAWRYGDQFGRRRLKYGVIAAVAVATPVLQLTTQFGGIALNLMSGWTSATSAALSIVGSVAVVGGTAFNEVRQYRSNVPRANVRDDDGQLRSITQANLDQAVLRLPSAEYGWELGIPFGKLVSAGPIGRAIGGPVKAVPGSQLARVSGENALRTLSRLMPRINQAGGGKTAARDAVGLVESSNDLVNMLRPSATRTPRKSPFNTVAQGQIRGYPDAVRIALEMALHSEDERRAMEGELQELERRWREADEIAKIADAMFLPENIDSTIQEMRHRQNRSEPEG